MLPPTPPPTSRSLSQRSPPRQERPGEQFVSRIALRKAQASLRKPELGSTSDEEESGTFAFEEERGGEGDENERPPPPPTSIFEQIESVWVHHRISVVCLQTFIFAVCFQVRGKQQCKADKYMYITLFLFSLLFFFSPASPTYTQVSLLCTTTMRARARNSQCWKTSLLGTRPFL